MRCAVKYCGGCNPRFDRVGFVRRLQGEFPQVEFAPFRIGAEYGFALVVCGCLSRCAAIPDGAGTGEKMVICAQEDFPQASRRLAEVLERDCGNCEK